MRELENFLISVEKRAYRMARMATHGDADALDIVQDAMLKLVQKYADRGAEQWRPLFFKILETRILDWHRKQQLKRRLFFWQREAEEPDESGLNPLEFVESGPQAQVMSEQLGEHLMGAIEALPLKQQQCFLLRAWEGLSVAEAALAMGINESSVKTHHARALQKLTRQYEVFGKEFGTEIEA